MRLHRLPQDLREIPAPVLGLREAPEPPPPAVVTGNWAGYAETANAPYSTVAAHWTIPAVTGHAASTAFASFWIGIDGFNNGVLEQCGVVVTNPTSGGNTYAAWVEFIAAYEEWWSPAHYPVVAGDSFSASITWNPSTQFFDMTLADSTQGWTYTEAKSLQAAVAEESGTPALASIEVVVEGTPPPLADFGTITFTSVTPMTSPIPITMVNSHTLATPGTLAGNSFTVTWNNYS
jgi:Peptidase A4 family